MEIFVLWLAFSGLAAWIASNKGRSGVGVFFLSVLLSPLIGIIVALVMKSKRDMDREAVDDAPSARTHTRCPECKELVRKDAIKCKHCGAHLEASVINPSVQLVDGKCPKCHAKNADTATQCTFCHTPLVTS